MDETSLHTEHFMEKSIKNREAEALHKSTQFPVDVIGNMQGDEDGRVTKTKKLFKQNTLYYKAMQESVLPEEKPILIPAYIEESNLERDNRIVLYVKGDPKTLDEMHHLFSQAGQIKSMLFSFDEVLKKLSVEIEFYSIKSVAVAVAVAVKERLSNVYTKAKSICVDSYRFPVEEAEIDRFLVEEAEIDQFLVEEAEIDRFPVEVPYIFDRVVFVGFSHIPMTVDWLEKIFRVFGVVEKIRLPRPPNHIHMGYANLQFESVYDKVEALRMNQQLKFSYMNTEVEMEVTAFDGTEWPRDGDLEIVSVSPERDTGSP